MYTIKQAELDVAKVPGWRLESAHFEEYRDEPPQWSVRIVGNIRRHDAPDGDEHGGYRHTTDDEIEVAIHLDHEMLKTAVLRCVEAALEVTG